MSTSLEFKKIFPCKKKGWVMIMCPHEFDVALCSITVKNAALSFPLIGHLYCRIMLCLSSQNCFSQLFMQWKYLCLSAYTESILGVPVFKSHDYVFAILYKSRNSQQKHLEHSFYGK